MHHVLLVREHLLKCLPFGLFSGVICGAVFGCIFGALVIVAVGGFIFWRKKR